MFDMKTGGWFAKSNSQDVTVAATLWPKGLKLNDGIQISPPGAFTLEGSNNSFVGVLPKGVESVRWGDINMIEINVHQSETDVSFQHITVTAIDVNGHPLVLVDKTYEFGHLTLTNDCTIKLPTLRPQAASPPPSRPAEEIEEDAKFKEFNEHLLNRRPHYERTLRLGAPPALRAFDLAGLGVGGGASLLEKVDNRPLEVLGDYVAYPCVDPVWSKKIMAAITALGLPDVLPVERLITLPTRGVFAEAKLGHCTASEEIDNTRFWDWQQSPIPHLAPEIAPVQPVTPQPIPATGLQATPFPQSLVNIVNPPSAPDPQGMTAALTALATANIFRDMSGRTEVADLLKKLSDNSVAIAGVAQRAATAGSGAGAGAGGGGVGIGGPRAAPNQPSSGTRDLQDLGTTLRQAQANGLASPETAQDIWEKAARETYAPDSLFQNIADAGASQAPPPQGVRQEWLDSIATVNFASGADINNWFLARTGQDFIDWFNSTHANKGAWGNHQATRADGTKFTDFSARTITGNDPFDPSRSVPLAVVKQRFNDFWERIPLICAPSTQISPVQFLSLMSIGINERNGNMVSIPEGGNLKYMFEKKANGGSPYNIVSATLHQRTAFTLFNDDAYIAAHGAKALAAQLKQTTDTRWAGPVWPSEFSASTDPAVTGFVQEADFFKFRGRGVIQTTWRGGYLRLIDFVQNYIDANAVIAGFHTQWTGQSGEDSATRSSNADWDALFAEADFVAHAIAIHNEQNGDYLKFDIEADAPDGHGLNGTKPGSIWNMGARIGWPAYGDHFKRRVMQLINSLGNDPNQAPAPAPGGGVNF